MSTFDGNEIILGLYQFNLICVPLGFGADQIMFVQTRLFDSVIILPLNVSLRYDINAVSTAFPSLYFSVARTSLTLKCSRLTEML